MRAFLHLPLLLAVATGANAASIAPNIASPDPAPPYAAEAGFLHETLQENFQDGGADMAKNTIANPAYFWYNGVTGCCEEFTDTSNLSVTYPTPYDTRTGAAFFPYTWNGNGIVAHASLMSSSNGGKVWSNGVATSVAGNGLGWTQAFGYFEVRARVSGTKASWAAPLWLVSQACFKGLTGCGEIDVIEQYSEYPTAYSATVHDYQNGVGTENDVDTGITLSAGFNIYGLLITRPVGSTPSTIKFYFNHVQIGNTVTTPAPLVGQPFYLVFDQGIGGACFPCQATSGAPNPVTHIRSIHVWGD